MRLRLFTMLVLGVGMIVLLAIGAMAEETPVQTAAPVDEPLVLTLNGSEPQTIDPALASFTNEVAVIDQIFAGLTRTDAAMGQTIPDLATGWEVSADTTVFTFTLRSGLVWSDGRPLQAEDVRYGVLRSLAPDTNGDYAPILYTIRNAEAYHTGAISDPSEVGAAALDATHIRFDLEYPFAFFPDLASLWVARPMPAWAIDAWGDAWTEPEHIVTSGPYHLSEWEHGDHITLAKNPAFYGAAGTQVERVNWLMKDGNTAWELYRTGQLDALDLPSDLVGPASDDPVLSQQVTQAPNGCTFYYGFSVTQPPFDNALVRRAFVAGFDRQRFIDAAQNGLGQAALTFTPPGIFGHVDGQAQGVGIPFDPGQGRQWLSDAGYPNGQGLPPVVLAFTESSRNRLRAEVVRQIWIDSLGVTATLLPLSAGEYSARSGRGEIPLYLVGWCSDYNDAYNFLHDGVEFLRLRSGGWNNGAYDDLLAQMVQTANPSDRLPLYQQAEEILVESDAVMIPIWYGITPVASRPYIAQRALQRGVGYLADWRLDFDDQAQVTLNAAAVFTPTIDYVRYEFPAGAFAGDATVTHTARRPGELPSTAELIGLGRAFDVAAVDAAGQPVSPARPYTMAVPYGDLERGPIVESTLALYTWDGSQWLREPTSVVDPLANTITATPDHFSAWMILGETHRMHFPLALRN